ncbi:MAG: HNH endonuclease [DPANN group archaeon]|nr:HNH endonuclease [DPANN group archaeon]
MVCNYCNKKCGSYHLCKKCDKLKKADKLTKCEDCGKWKKSNKPLCHVCWNKNKHKENNIKFENNIIEGKKIDQNGYERGKWEHSTLIHRQVAYHDIYLLNRDDYPLKFAQYVIHHIDGNKRNNHRSNLMILTPEQHSIIHNIIVTPKINNKIKQNPIDKEKASLSQNIIDFELKQQEEHINEKEPIFSQYISELELKNKQEPIGQEHNRPKSINKQNPSKSFWKQYGIVIIASLLYSLFSFSKNILENGGIFILLSYLFISVSVFSVLFFVKFKIFSNKKSNISNGFVTIVIIFLFFILVSIVSSFYEGDNCIYVVPMINSEDGIATISEQFNENLAIAYCGDEAEKKWRELGVIDDKYIFKKGRFASIKELWSILVLKLEY